jgi:hypothetical protein
MMLKHANDIISDRHRLRGIAQQVSHHSHITGVRKFDKDRQIRPMLPQRRMGGVPDALPTEDPATWIMSRPSRSPIQ